MGPAGQKPVGIPRLLVRNAPTTMHRLRALLDPYIALMFAVIGVAALWPARGNGAVAAGVAADAAIIFLFFLYGTRIAPKAALDGLSQWKLHGAVLVCTYALFPVLGLALAPALPDDMPPAIASGFLFLCVLPSTVQSSIAFTAIARGNVPAALGAASLSNIVGVFASPLLAGWLLQAQGVSLSFGVLRDIMLQLLAPFIAGQLLRPVVGAWVQKHRGVLGLVDRGAILLIIYVAFSHGMVEGVWTHLRLGDLAVLTTLLCVLLALTLGLTSLAGRHLYAFSREDAIVLQFAGSKKSLASGLPMAGVIFHGAQLSMIILPLMIFHQIQLIVCAVLARRYGMAAGGERGVATGTEP